MGQSESTAAENNQDDSLLEKRTTYHKPTPMKVEDIFNLYTEAIEQDFAKNQHQYENLIKNKKSAMAVV